METHLIRQLDLLAGKPLCSTLTLLERLQRRVRGLPTGPPQRILFVKLIEMGSTVLAGPALIEAERLVGPDNVYMLVFASNRHIVDLLPQVPRQNVIAVDDRDLAHFVRSLLVALQRVRTERIDVVVDLEGMTRSSAIITWLTGAPRRVGFFNFSAEGPYRGRLFTHELSYSFQHHTALSFLALVRAIETQPTGEPLLKEPLPTEPLLPPRVEPRPRDLAAVQALLREVFEVGPQQPLPSPLIILNPNCGDLLPLRKWPERHYIELGKHLLEQVPGLHLVLTGCEREAVETERLARAIGPSTTVVSLAGRTSVAELVALYGLCDVLVSSDSGPCHFATLSDIHVVALFGPETPALYGPLGPRATSISAQLACSPCLNILNHRLSDCRDALCMEAIEVDQVIDATMAALAKRSERGA